MKMRGVTICVLSGISALTIAATLRQGERIAGLRAEQNSLAAEQSGTVASFPLRPALVQAQASDSSELLRLRNEVNMLTHRKQELAPIQRENQNLKTQLASARTNATAALPAGYILKSQAQNVGLSTPENTLETLLWALRNKNAAVFLQTLTPESVQEIQADEQRSGHSLAQNFEEAAQVPGFRVVKTETAEPGSVEADVEIMPGKPSQRMEFQQINGAWRLKF